jgi:hypothetical protein
VKFADDTRGLPRCQPVFIPVFIAADTAKSTVFERAPLNCWKNFASAEPLWSRFSIYRVGGFSQSVFDWHGREVSNLLGFRTPSLVKARQRLVYLNSVPSNKVELKGLSKRKNVTPSIEELP